jgi:cation:H+ antiporter
LALLLIGYLVYLSRIPDKRPGKSDGNSEKSGQSVTGRGLLWTLMVIVAGIALMMFASRWIVTGAVSIADSMGMSELVIGLTIVAVGTSLPEIATTLVAVRHNHHELAVGNVMGSCFFNIVAVPMAMAMLSSTALPVNSHAVAVDLPLMIVVIIACMPIFLTGHRVSKPEGALFLIYYMAYVLILYYRGLSENGVSNHLFELAILATPILVITMIIIAAGIARNGLLFLKGNRL